MFDLPNVTYISKEKIEDPDWKPPFDAGIIITNFALNGDESTPHLHMTFVPYSDNCSRGQQTQNALSQTFARMGYKTTMKHAVDKNDELVWQNTPDGRKPQMVRDTFGVIEWIEEQKEWLAEEMYHDMLVLAHNGKLLDKAVQLQCENEQLKSKVQELQSKLQQAYDFMK